MRKARSKPKPKSKYKAIKINGVKRDQHRYLMEQYLGRTLTSSEVVHHRNENKRDNRLENLQVMTRAEHARLHQTGHVYSEEIRRARSERMTGQPNLACRKLSDSDVRYIKNNYIPGDSEYGLRAMSQRFNISHSQLSHIVNGKSYREVI